MNGLMKNRILIISLLLAAVCTLSGCDMFRSIAGRPTSEELDACRMELKAREAAEQARLAALEMAQKHLRDSIAADEAALDTLKGMGGLLRDPSRLGGFLSAPGSRYYVVAGSFKDGGNAQRYMERILDAGYGAELIRFKSGLTSVGACPSDSPAAFIEQLGRIKDEEFFPKDFWILVNE